MGHDTDGKAPWWLLARTRRRLQVLLVLGVVMVVDGVASLVFDVRHWGGWVGLACGGFVCVSARASQRLLRRPLADASTG